MMRVTLSKMKKTSYNDRSQGVLRQGNIITIPMTGRERGFVDGIRR